MTSLSKRENKIEEEEKRRSLFTKTIAPPGLALNPAARCFKSSARASIIYHAPSGPSS